MAGKHLPAQTRVRVNRLWFGLVGRYGVINRGQDGGAQWVYLITFDQPVYLADGNAARCDWFCERDLEIAKPRLTVVK